MHNAIDAKKFEYNPEKRLEVRKILKVEDKLVIGHIGRFTKQKNHDFLLDIFKAVKQKTNNAVLVLVGTGELENYIKEKIVKLGIESDVIMLGGRNDVDLLYQGFDVFCLPSYHEGLPVVGVEAQASGVYLFASDQITEETKITKNIEFLPINDPWLWANQIVEKTNSYIRKSTYKEIKNSGYDIKEQASLIQNEYMHLHQSI
jgi:glycosyltransferase involved in cell wall biosynthesis